MRNRMGKALSKRGYTVFTAANYIEGVEIIAQRKPDAAVVALKLGRKSGLDVLKTGIRHHPSIRIVILTGYGSIATATQSIKLGAWGYLTKPAKIKEILASLDTDLSRYAAIDLQVPSLARVEWEHINRILFDCHNNISLTAKKLGIHRRTLQRKLQKAPPNER